MGELIVIINSDCPFQQRFHKGVLRNTAGNQRQSIYH